MTLDELPDADPWYSGVAPSYACLSCRYAWTITVQKTGYALGQDRRVSPTGGWVPITCPFCHAPHNKMTRLDVGEGDAPPD